MAGPSPILKARVDEGVYERFVALAKARRMSESELLRTAINRELGRSADEAAPAVLDAQGGALNRTTIRLPLNITQVAKSRAETKGMKLGRWIAALVQSHVSQQPVMTEAEIAAVEAATRELGAIGRNINQIARALNEAHFRVERVRLDRLAELADAIKATRQQIKSLVQASRNGWSDDL